MADDFKALTSRRALQPRRIREIYHDATYAKERSQALFQSGVLSLQARASAEQIYFAIMNALARAVQGDRDEYEDIVAELVLPRRRTSAISRFSSLCR